MIYELHQAQQKIVDSRARFRVVNCGRRFGKALALDTPILTTEGYKNLIDVKVGDFVFNENGNQVEVLYKSGVYTNRNCYLVVFSDGSSVVADESHDWLVENKRYRKNKNRSGNVVLVKRTTKDLRESLRYLGRESNYSISLAKAVVHIEKTLEIEPYFLGLWLGDGNSENCGITTVDKEIVDYLDGFSRRLG